jgi:hypothetical protein
MRMMGRRYLRKQYAHNGGKGQMSASTINTIIQGLRDKSVHVYVSLSHLL